MARISALTALVLANSIVSPQVAAARQFLDGAAGHCLLCDFLGEPQRRGADADCRRPAADDIGGSEQTNEQTGHTD